MKTSLPWPRTRQRRWGDHDKHFGPITYSKDGNDPVYSISLNSGDNDEDAGCCLFLRGFGHTLIVELPQIIRPWREWVDMTKYAWNTNPAGGYWDEHERVYGFAISSKGSFLQLWHGARTDDSLTDHTWCKHLPWANWRFVRFTLFDKIGNVYWSVTKAPRGSYDAQREATELCPKVAFIFADYDGETITATTHLEEREWRFGTGWFKWLSIFRKPKVRRSLSISFSKQVGPEKGSWKGGTLGHGIEVVPGELHRSAFMRYCDEHNLVFGGELDEQTMP